MVSSNSKMNIFVFSTSFCVVSVVNAGLLTSALTGGLQKVLDVIKNPIPVTIEIHSQGQRFPSPQYVGDNPPYGYPPPEPPQHPHYPPHPPHHPHHHGHRPSDPYPRPPPMGGGEYPPHYPIGGMDHFYPNGPGIDVMNRPNHNYYPDGNRQNAQQYGQNGGSYDQNVEHPYGEMGGQNGNEYGDDGSKMEFQDTAVSDKQDGTGIDGYINGFPVILLTENEIR